MMESAEHLFLARASPTCEKSAGVPPNLVSLRESNLELVEMIGASSERRPPKVGLVIRGYPWSALKARNVSLYRKAAARGTRACDGGSRPPKLWVSNVHGVLCTGYGVEAPGHSPEA